MVSHSEAMMRVEAVSLDNCHCIGSDHGQDLHDRPIMARHLHAPSWFHRGSPPPRNSLAPRNFGILSCFKAELLSIEHVERESVSMKHIKHEYEAYQA